MIDIMLNIADERERERERESEWHVDDGDAEMADERREREERRS